MFVSVLTILVLSLEFIFTSGLISDTGGQCMTPNHENATCIAASNCKVIVDAAKSRNPEVQRFAKESYCGMTESGLPLLCCGSHGSFVNMPTTEFNIFSYILSQTTPKPITFETLGPNLPDTSFCGAVEQENFRIAGGAEAKLDEFPWTAALEYQLKAPNFTNVGVKCGGSLINTKYVLTAAHCLLTAGLDLIAVRLGEWNISGDPSQPDCLDQGGIYKQCNKGAQVFKINDTIPHQYYDPTTIQDDIGLIRLDREVEYNEFIRPICIPPANLPTLEINSLLTVTGWGATENNKNSEIKLKVEVPLRSNDDCRKAFTIQITVDKLCAGGEEGKDSCEGDSGGPLMRIYEDANNPQRWFLEGVVSYGFNCNKRVPTPAIYTRISRYLIWILTNLAEE